MMHRATVLHEDTLSCFQDFEFLCEAVDYCNSNSKVGDTCVVSEVYHSLTGVEDYGTITTWVENKEWA